MSELHCIRCGTAVRVASDDPMGTMYYVDADGSEHVCKAAPVESGLSITGGESQPIPILPVVSADEMPDLYDLFRDVVIATGVCRDVMDFEHGAFAENNPKLHMFISQFHGGLRKWADALDKAQKERDAGVYADIRVERMRQNEQWGGPEHDDRNIISDWRAYRQKFERRASAEVTGADRVIRRDALVKIAALTVAQIESLDRASQSTSGVKE